MHPEIETFAKKLTDAGLRVYVANNGEGTYGFFTDGERVVSFRLDRLHGWLFSGAYVASTQGGTGWGLDAPASLDAVSPEKAKEMLRKPAPAWANPSPIYVNEAQQLERYGTSSNYVRV